jgi:hypothetical protein
LQTVHLRHAQVQDSEVWSEMLDFRDCISTIDGFSAYFPIRMIFEQSPQQAAYRGVIVRDQYPDRHWILSQRPRCRREGTDQIF